MIRKVFFVCTFLLLATDARAQTVTDERVWFTLILQEPGTAGSPWRWSFETYLRSREGVDDLDSMGLRPVLLYAVTPKSTVGGGYVLAPSFPVTGETLIEHRAFGHYGWSSRAVGGTLAFRTRVEARFLENNSGVAGRLRQQVRFTHAFRHGSRLSWSAYDEILIAMNDTPRTPRGLDSNRLFGGLVIAIPHSMRVDLGYLNQFLPGHRGAQDRMNHVLSSTLTVSF